MAGVVVFAITYVLISMRRLSWLGFDRPAGALLGAVAAVVVGALTPERAIAAIDGATLLLLFGVMGMGAFLAVDGFFAHLELRMVAIARTPVRLMGAIVWASGLLSALITNDAVCVLGAPVVVRIVQRHRLPPLPFLLALAVSANTGSVATLVGNPQNMLCANLGDLDYLEHLALAAPIAIVGLALGHALIAIAFRSALGAARIDPAAIEIAAPLSRRAKVSLAVIGGTAVAYSLGTDLPWTATAGFVALMLLHRRDTRELWPRIDWSLLLFFAGLFVVVQGLLDSGAPAWVFERFPLVGTEDGVAGTLRLAGVFLVGSNVVSNVPFILVVQEAMGSLPDPRLGWELLAVASTFAGNLTLLGSVANVIVAESARDVGGLGFVDHLKVGLPLAFVTTILGALWIAWAGPFLLSI